jgi:hypothetical protein
MGSLLRSVLDWSEVWATLIPLAILIVRRKQPRQFTPVIVFLLLALVIGILIDVGWKFKHDVPEWLQDNNYLYNVLSIVRFICFSFFFIKLGQGLRTGVKRLVPLLSVAFLVINFTVSEHFFEKISFSSRLLAVEAGLILFYCLQYYLYKMKQDVAADDQPANDWVVWGLSIYVIFNFPFFLLYKTLSDSEATVPFILSYWDFHNISFIILCIFIAKAFYVAGDR